MKIPSNGGIAVTNSYVCHQEASDLMYAYSFFFLDDVLIKTIAPVDGYR
jgi:hypothetical protein